MNFRFSLTVSATYVTDIPTLEILMGGVVISSTLISNLTSDGTVTYDFDLSYEDVFPDFSIQFNDSLTEPNRQIRIDDININGQNLNPLLFGLTGDAFANANAVSLNEVGDNIGLNPAIPDYVFGINEPTLSDLGTITHAGTAGNDSALNGSQQNDVIYGDDGQDTISALAGDDRIHGGAGNDRIIGHDGDDVILGGTGNDALFGRNDDDIIFGGEGDDFLSGDDGNDIINGGDGRDRIFGGTGDDVIRGGAGNDRIVAGEGNDIIDGGDDRDQIIAGEGNDILNGDLGSDLLDGGEGDDILNGGEGDDRLLSGLGNDELNGGLGNDVLISQGGINVLNGDEGNDQLYANSDGDTLNGGEGDDNLYGNNAIDILNGDAGNDRIFAGSNNDIIDGGEGNDEIHGDAGDDVAQGGLGDDVLNGGTGNDELNGNEGADSIRGDEGNDTLNGGDGNDTIRGGEGFDTLNGDEGNDRLFGDAGNDILNGGAGGDRLRGNDGDDILNGDDGNDRLFGDAGADQLFGGAGDDTLFAATLSTNPIDVLNATFDSDLDGFIYADGGFGGSDPTAVDYARGAFDATDGNTAGSGNGSAQIILGGVDAEDIANISGNIQQSFALTNSAVNTVLSFSYRVEHTEQGTGTDDFDAGEDLQLYITIDGRQIGATSSNGSFAEFANPDNDFDSGWVNVTFDVGFLNAGTHDLALGGLLTLKTFEPEEISVSFDDISITAEEIIGDNGVTNILSGGTGNDDLFGALGDDILYGVSAENSALSSAASGLTTLYTANFNTNSDGFIYSDGGFGGSDPTAVDYARGSFITTDGNSSGSGNGALEIILGGVDNADIDDLSGNFEQTITLATATTNSSLSFSYLVEHTALGAGTDDFDAGEDLQLFVEIDGVQLDNGTGNGFFVEFLDPDRDFNSGWVNVTFDTGALSAGSHTISLGGLLTRKTFEPEEIAVRFDDIILTSQDSSVTTGSTNTLYGRGGADTLYGSTETDIFVFERTTAFSGIDTIENFNAPQGDALDISDVLSGYDSLTSNINDFIQFTNNGSNTLVHIDANGAAGGSNFTAIAEIQDLTDLNATSFLANGNIIA